MLRYASFVRTRTCVTDTCKAKRWRQIPLRWNVEGDLASVAQRGYALDVPAHTRWRKCACLCVRWITWWRRWAFHELVSSVRILAKGPKDVMPWTIQSLGTITSEIVALGNQLVIVSSLYADSTCVCCWLLQVGSEARKMIADCEECMMSYEAKIELWCLIYKFGSGKLVLQT